MAKVVPTPNPDQLKAIEDFKATNGANWKSVLTEAFKLNARFYAFQPEDLGRQFTSASGKQFILTGMNPKGKQYKLVARCVEDGKTYKFTTDQVFRALHPVR